MPIQYESYTESSEPHMYHFRCVCTQCNKAYKISVHGQDLFDYRQGKSVQQAFPYLSAGDRELLCLSNICDTCFHKLFVEEDTLE